MKPRTVLYLGAAVAALGVFIAVYERKLPSSEERAASAKKLVAWKPEDVTRLTLEWQGAEVRLAREGEAGALRWQLVAPLAARADRYAVDGLLRGLANLEHKRVLEGAVTADVGLDKPRGRVTWTTPAGDNTLVVGAAVPASEDVVVALGGNTFITDGSFVSDLSRAPGGWRDRMVFTGERGAISRIRLTPAGATAPAVTLERDGSLFRLAAPRSDAADREAVESLLADLTGLSAQAFLDQPQLGLDAMGLAPAPARVEVNFEGPLPPLVVEVGAPATAAPGAPRYLRVTSGDSRQLIEATVRLADSAALPPDAWRSRAWTRYASYDVEKLSVRGGGPALELNRAGVNWRRGSDTISFTEVSDLLTAITSATAAHLTDGPAPTAGAPTVLTLVDAKGQEEVLQLFPSADPGAAEVPATSSARPGVVLGLPASAAQELTRQLEAVRRASVIPPGTGTGS